MKVLKVIGALMVGAIMLASVSSQANPVQGMIAFTGNAKVTSTGVNDWLDTKVAGVIGFGGLVSAGNAVTMSDPWSFSSGQLNGLWSVNNFVFDLTSSSVVFQGLGAVLVNGMGTISGNGYDTTYGSWTFYSKIPKTGQICTPIFSFTVAGCPVPQSSGGSGTSVADGGTTLILLGLALSVVAILRQILRKGIA